MKRGEEISIELESAMYNQRYFMDGEYDKKYWFIRNKKWYSEDEIKRALCDCKDFGNSIGRLIDEYDFRKNLFGTEYDK